MLAAVAVGVGALVAVGGGAGLGVGVGCEGWQPVPLKATSASRTISIKGIFRGIGASLQVGWPVGRQNGLWQDVLYPETRADAALHCAALQVQRLGQPRALLQGDSGCHMP